MKQSADRRFADEVEDVGRGLGGVGLGSAADHASYPRRAKRRSRRASPVMPPANSFSSMSAMRRRTQAPLDDCRLHDVGIAPTCSISSRLAKAANSDLGEIRATSNPSEPVPSVKSIRWRG
jgi:hypothetical protein